MPMISNQLQRFIIKANLTRDWIVGGRKDEPAGEKLLEL